MSMDSRTVLRSAGGVDGIEGASAGGLPVTATIEDFRIQPQDRNLGLLNRWNGRALNTDGEPRTHVEAELLLNAVTQISFAGVAWELEAELGKLAPQLLAPGAKMIGAGNGPFELSYFRGTTHPNLNQDGAHPGLKDLEVNPTPVTDCIKVTVSPEMAKIAAAQKPPYSKVVLAAVAEGFTKDNMGIEPGSVDLIWHSDGLQRDVSRVNPEEYKGPFNEDDLRRILSSAHAALKDGGVYAAIYLTPLNWVNKDKGPNPFTTPLDPERVTAIAKELGFKILLDKDVPSIDSNHRLGNVGSQFLVLQK